MDAVTIAVEQIACRDLHAADLNGLSEFRDVRVSVRNSQALCEALKAHRLNGAEIPHGSVCNIPGATERLAHPRVNLAEQRTYTRNPVYILNDENFGPGNAGNVLPPVGTLVVAKPGDGWRGSTHPGSDGVSGHRPQLWGQAMGIAMDVSFVAHADIEDFNCIRHGTGIRSLQESKKLRRDVRQCFHL